MISTERAAEKERDGWSGVGRRKEEHQTARQHCKKIIKDDLQAKHLRLRKSPNLVKNLISPSFHTEISVPGIRIDVVSC